MRFNKNISSVRDYEDVVATVEAYVEGLRVGSVEKLKSAFYKNAVMYGFSPGGLLEGPIDNLYTFVERYGPAKDVSAHIDVLDITTTTAVVRVTMENDAQGGDFTDFHSLIKLDGQWKVIAKLYHMYDK